MARDKRERANRKYERFSSAPTVEPVAMGGWYELTDGRIAEFQWVSGQLVKTREAASWEIVRMLQDQDVPGV